MDRYSSTKIKKNEDSNRVYKTMLIPNIQRQSDDIYIIAKATDRLDLLAKKYYNDTSYWWVIAEANNIGKGSLFVEPGKQIRIPSQGNNIDGLISDTQERR